MRRLLASRFVLAVLVLAAVAALYGVAGLSHGVTLGQARAPRLAVRTAVSFATRACPPPGPAGSTSGSLAVMAGGAPAGAGQAVLSRLSAGGGAAAAAPVGVLTRPGTLAVTAVPGVAASSGRGPSQRAGTSSVPTSQEGGGVMITATGSMSRGLEVEQALAGGVVTGRCDGPGSDFWFVGPGDQSAADIELSLMNVDGQQADAQVQVLTDSGPLLAGSDAGIVVPPHGAVVQSLAGLLHGSRIIALQVTASLGRVVAALRESRRPSQPGGWVPATQEPARRLVLPGLPPGRGAPQLYLAVPGNRTAQVTVTAVTAKGSYQPTGGTGISLPGSTAGTVALPSLAGTAAAVQVRSNVPVAAALVVPGGAPGAPGALIAAALPVQQQGVIADSPAAGAGSAELVLSAPAAAASVRIAEASAASALGSQPVQVVRLAAGHTVALGLSPPASAPRRGPFAVSITPAAGSGPVYAGRVISTGGTVRSVLAVASSLSWIPLPAVRDSLTAVLP